MSLTVTDIFNQALSSLGGNGITSAEENSREAALCRLRYPHLRSQILSAAPWPSVRKYEYLALRASNTTGVYVTGGPAPGYTFAFSPPSDLLHPYHLHSYGRFEYSLGPTGRQISCSEEAPLLFYNANITDPALWEFPLVNAVIHGLAAVLARPLTGRGQQVQESYQIAAEEIEGARARAANSQDEQDDTLPDWLVARRGAHVATSRYIYPFLTFGVPGE